MVPDGWEGTPRRGNGGYEFGFLMGFRVGFIGEVKSPVEMGSGGCLKTRRLPTVRPANLVAEERRL